MLLDQDVCYRAVKGRDRRFDGVFYTAVRTTGIYCRPSCPATTPKRGNVTFYPSAAACQGAGYRACLRCLPDATPGSPEWDVAADVAGRAMRLIADGVVERDGVSGLAQGLGYSVRQLNRLVTDQLGAGPLALSRARRAQTARVLVETTDLGLADIAFASGFGSVRQFNDTLREVYAVAPRELRNRHRGRAPQPMAGAVHVRIAVREPYDAAALLGFLRVRAIPGVEHVTDDAYERTLRLPHGHGVVRVELGERPACVVLATYWLSDARDLAPALERTRRLLDADADPLPVADLLSADDVLATLVERHPGLRVPGHVDGDEVAARAVLGQQVTLAAARTLAVRLVDAVGEPLALAGHDGNVDRMFPSAAALAGVGDDLLAMPQARKRAFVTLMAALAAGDVVFDRSRDRDEVRRSLLALPGIGPWTSDYIALRALGDPDVFLPGDTGVRDACRALGVDDVSVRAERWRPWRSYALTHLWQSLGEEHLPDPTPPEEKR